MGEKEDVGGEAEMEDDDDDDCGKPLMGRRRGIL